MFLLKIPLHIFCINNNNYSIIEIKLFENNPAN